MELKLPKAQDLSRIWQDSFLGHTGFFIPGEREFTLGREMDLVLYVEGEHWGSLRMVPVWANIYGPASQDQPRGTFLKLLSCPPELEASIRENYSGT